MVTSSVKLYMCLLFVTLTLPVKFNDAVVHVIIVNKFFFIKTPNIDNNEEIKCIVLEHIVARY